MKFTSFLLLLLTVTLLGNSQTAEARCSCIESVEATSQTRSKVVYEWDEVHDAESYSIVVFVNGQEEFTHNVASNRYDLDKSLFTDYPESIYELYFYTECDETPGQNRCKQPPADFTMAVEIIYDQNVGFEVQGEYKHDTKYRLTIGDKLTGITESEYDHYSSNCFAGFVWDYTNMYLSNIEGNPSDLSYVDYLDNENVLDEMRIVLLEDMLENNFKPIDEHLLAGNCGLTPKSGNQLSIDCDIYPNPFINEIIIAGPTSEQEATFLLYDSEGKQVLAKQLRGESRLSLPSFLPAGIYYSQVMLGEQILDSSTLIKL